MSMYIYIYICIYIYIYICPLERFFLRWGPIGRKSAIKSQHEVVFQIRCVNTLEESRWPTRKSLKNKELFRIAHMDWPSMGTRKSLVDRLGRALKTRSCYGLHTWIGHAWEVFDWWTCALVTDSYSLKTRSCSRLHPWMVHAWEVLDWCIHGPTRRALKAQSCSGFNFLI